MIPYARQTIDDDDIQAVVQVLRSDWLTTGPQVAAFENAMAQYVGARYAVALSSGTAALHAALAALGIGPGDEVIVPALTFAATANAVVFVGAQPVFADVDPEQLLIDPRDVERKITARTKAVIPVDYTGHPCDYDHLQAICRQRKLALVDDACHALGAQYRGRRIGTLADLTAFSFHPAKHITTGEGGMLVTDDEELARRTRAFRHHGLNLDHHQRAERVAWASDMVDLGYNYRLTDIQSALGLSQLKKLPTFLARRNEVARRYAAAFQGLETIKSLGVSPDVTHAYHLYVVLLPGTRDRYVVFPRLREQGIGVGVHYIPVHLHPFYRTSFGTAPGFCPVAEEAGERILSLPMYPGLTDEDIQEVIAKVLAATTGLGGRS